MKERMRAAEAQAEEHLERYIREVLSAMAAGEIVPDDVLSWIVFHVSPLPVRARLYIADRLEKGTRPGRPAERLRDEFRYEHGGAFLPGTASIARSIARDDEARELLREFGELRETCGGSRSAYQALGERYYRSETTMRDRVREARRRLAE